MIVSTLAELPGVATRAIIINCSTRQVSTLALMSVLRHANMPVLLIDCASTDGSWAWFSTLAKQYSFDLLKMPLRPHGKTLDRIFRDSCDESLLLVDSDLEILQGDVMSKLADAMTDSTAYGAGFLHQGGAMPANAQIKASGGRYMDRMWIPFCLLKVASVKRALAAGSTFMHSRDYLEFPWHGGLSRLIYARHRLPGLRRISLEVFANRRERIHGERVPFREYDTGARVHRALVGQGQHLAHLGEPYWSQSLRHYHGVTRATLTQDFQNATAPDAIAAEVAARLASEYQLVVG